MAYLCKKDEIDAKSTCRGWCTGLFHHNKKTGTFTNTWNYIMVLEEMTLFVGWFIYSRVFFILSWSLLEVLLYLVSMPL